MATRAKKVTAPDPKPTVEKAEVKETVKKREFKNDDLIPCVSITAGELLVTAPRSNRGRYDFFGDGDVQSIEYQDLVAMTRMHDKVLYAPKIIVKDDDFLDEHKDLKEVYGGLYNSSDLRKILTLSPDQMRAVIKKLPNGAKESLVTIASTAIDNKTLDSVQRVKVIDEEFGTDLQMKLMQ